MTRKDFKLIADVFAQHAAFHDTREAPRGHAVEWASEVKRRNLARDMASVLQSTNWQFDRDRFLTACKVPV